MGKLSKYSFELLADYVDGLVDRELASRMEADIQEDEALQGIVDGIRWYYSKHGNDRDGLESYLDQLAEDMAGSRQESGKIRQIEKPDFSLMRVAAVLVFALGGLGTLWFASRNAPSLEDLLTGYLEEPYRAPRTMRAGEQEPQALNAADSLNQMIEQSWKEFREMYEAGEWQDAAKLWTETENEIHRRLDEVPGLTENWEHPETVNTNEVRFYVGLSNLYSGNYRVAEQKLRDFPDSPWELHARWYRALALLETGDQQHAFEILEVLAEGYGADAFYAEKAGKLLRASN